MVFNSGDLILWYEKNKRELPWRPVHDPYLIWVSEIILQQTQVRQGLDYYKKFIHIFPTVESLAEADTESILTVWQGLGYYNRAINMQISAQVVMEKFGGYFPMDYTDILSLKGIGPYTAAAIASFAFGQPYPVIDGNVTRVLSRYFGIGHSKEKAFEKDIRLQAGVLIDKQRPGVYNQAIMEFGALQCVPANPECRRCPFPENCYAYQNDLVALLPPKKKKPGIRRRFLHYFIFTGNNKVLIRQRNKDSIWPGLFEFPCIETGSRTSTASVTKKARVFFGLEQGIPMTPVPGNIIHKLSHQIIHACFYKVEALPGGCARLPDHTVTEVSKLGDYALPALISSYLKRNPHIF